ncbi:MAG: hypothetical protein KGY53_12170 [Wenzhouxiangellaceae bacterium]|jgi:hypothetical protein|nr:hypothetical protein [Wenzhouxiangellaceae bacterium]
MLTGIGSAQWVVVASTTFIVLAAVIFHYEALSMLNRWACRRMHNSAPGHRRHYTLLIIMFGLLIAHVLEIWLFAVGHWALAESPSGAYGSVVGYDAFRFLDYVYFSVTNYTTVGWGDLHADGPLRFLAGTESLLGLMMITWSASFTYLIMSRTWRGIEGLED